MPEEHIYCIFCETGKETKVQDRLRELGFTVILPVVERMVFKRKKQTRELRPLLPGYVFLHHDCEPDWKKVNRLDYVYCALGYSDNSKVLRNKDLDFVHWVMRRNHIVEISKAVQVGTKVKIVSGPLKEWEGNIIRLNSRSKCAEVKIDTEGIAHKIWLSYELIKNAI
jgi:transcription antitermination factor NusG